MHNAILDLRVWLILFSVSSSPNVEQITIQVWNSLVVHTSLPTQKIVRKIFNACLAFSGTIFCFTGSYWIAIPIAVLAMKKKTKKNPFREEFNFECINLCNSVVCKKSLSVHYPLPCTVECDGVATSMSCKDVDMLLPQFAKVFGG